VFVNNIVILAGWNFFGGLFMGRGVSMKWLFLSEV